MALPKKKSRSISIDGEIYQYSISRSKTSEDGKFNLTLTAKNKKSNGACLIAKDEVVETVDRLEHPRPSTVEDERRVVLASP